MSILTPAQLARVRGFSQGGDATQAYVPEVTKTETRLDPITQQMLFGLDGQGGFIPGAFRAAERTFFDDQGRPIVIPTEIAGMSPDQIRAMELARSNVGVQQPFIDEAMRRGQQGIESLRSGFGNQELAQQQGLEAVREGSRFALDQRDRALMDSLGGVREGRGQALSAERGLRTGLSESEDLLRGTTGELDIGAATAKYQNPYEDQVVQQMIQDATKGLAKQDMAQYARDISSGGESAFGSRARLSAAERAEAMGKGLAQGVGALRSQGFQQAQQTAISEDERQRQAARAASSGLAGSAQQRFSAGTGLGQALSGYGAQSAAARGAAGQQGMGVAGALAGQYGSIGQQQAQAGQQLGAAQTGYGSFLGGLGSQAQQAGMADVNTLQGMGSFAQQQRQRELDAQRAGLLQAQQAPLAQYQALMPFVGMAPAGQTQFQTRFAPQPSALQAGVGTGLATLGALGNFYGQPQQYATNQRATPNFSIARQPYLGGNT